VSLTVSTFWGGKNKIEIQTASTSRDIARSD
jgi:hypothetical protein